MSEVQSETVAEMALLIEEGKKEDVTRLIFQNLEHQEEDLPEDTRLRIALEITEWMFEDDGSSL
jgi:hypothetical protein